MSVKYKFIEYKANSKAVPEREGGRRKPDGRVLANDKFMFNTEKMWGLKPSPRGEGGTAIAVTNEG